MQISIAGWSVSGTRCPDVSIDLKGKNGSPAQVALIQMPNGTGKTTTLNLLRAALTGTATNWTPAQIRAYRRPESDNESGQFSVTMLVDGKPVTFELLLDYDAGTASYRITHPGGGGVRTGWNPPLAMMQFLTPAFLDLFIFDGEFAEALFKQGTQRADEAIGALCQLDLLTYVKKTVEAQWKKATSQGGPKSSKELGKLNNERELLIVRHAKLIAARAAAQRKLEEGTAEAIELERKIDEKVGSVEATKAQFGEAQLALQKANSAVNLTSGRIMTLVRMPLALHPHFAEQLTELKENLDTLRLPETSSAQFFADLIDDEECICGREMDEVAKEEIKKRAKGYLDYDEAATINALKSDITRFVAPSEEESRNEQLKNSVDALNKAKRQQREAQQTLNVLNRKLYDAGDPEFQGWQDALDKLKSNLEAYKRSLEELDASGEEGGIQTESIKSVKRKLEEITLKIADLSKTVELKKKTDTLNGILERAEQLARDAIRADLLQATNERLEIVLANDPLRVGKIDQSLHLASQSDASTGQKLSVGYSFLMSALKRGNNDFPLIVDSPAGPIDEGVRRSIGKLIPELCTQFVGFTINTERVGFVQALERASEECLFFTLFRRTEGTRRLEVNLPSEGVTQTATATLVNGRDYFMQFDMTEED